MADDYYIVTTAVPDRATARAIARAVVEKKLAAGVQILGPVDSHYWWQGEICQAEEYLCLCRTTTRHQPALEAEILAMHPYVTPEVTALPIASGNHDFLAWITQSTGPATDPRSA